MLEVQITRMATHLPPRVETSAHLSPRIGRSAEWIERTTGVRQRHISDESQVAMAARVVRDLLGDDPPPDLLINASGVQYQVLPDSSVFIQQELGWNLVPSFSVHATCLSFIVALQTAAALIHAGTYRRIVIVSADQGHRGRNFAEPESAALLGDGAAAALVEPTAPGGTGAILAYQMETYPEGARLTEVAGGGTWRHPNDPRTVWADNHFRMNGPRVFRLARTYGVPFAEKLMARVDFRADELDVIVPHQASSMGVKAYRHYGFPEDRTVDVVGLHGNTVAASIPLALGTAVAEGTVRPGHRVLLVGTGAGLSIAGIILRW